MVQHIFLSIGYTIPLETCKEGSVAIQCCCFQLCAHHCHAPPTPRRTWVGIIGDLQEHLTNSPTPGDNFMLQIPYILYRDSKNNENSWTNAPTLGTNYADK